MQEFIQNFHFLRPWCLLLLIVPLILYFAYYQRLNATSSWEKVCDKNLLNFLLIKGSSIQRRIIFYICSIGFLFAVISASGPSWIKKEVESVSNSVPLMIVLNLSSDMMQDDITPNRLTRAKYAISDLLTEVKQASKGLIVYAGEPFLITPITEDSEIIKNLLPSIDFDIMPENGDRLDLALRLAQDSLRNGNWQQGQIVVFSSDVGQDFAKSLQIAEDIATQGFSINVVNVSQQNNDKLQRISQEGRGKYINVNNISSLSHYLNNSISTELKSSQNKIAQWLDYGYYLLIIPLLCCLYLFRKGILCVALFMFSINSANAGFFLNDNQEGLNKSDYQVAVQKFKDNKWLGASNYRLGNYEDAYKNFSNQTDDDGIYNQGNALAKMGKIEEAIKKYEQVLEKNPNHEDAKFNLEYLKQQNNQSSSSSSENEDKDDDQQNQDKQQGASPQNSEQQQNQDKTEQNQSDSDKEQDEQSQSQNADEQSQEEQQETSSRQQQQNQANNPQDKFNENQENSGSVLQNKEGDNTYNEEVQARELQYREIPEDVGGLLRAFIAKEYSKNRYAKDK